MNTYHIFFGKLANELKIKILTSLKNKKKSVQELTKDLNIEQSKLSHALASLKTCNIVKVKQSGKKRIYSINKETILPILKLIDKHEKKFCKQCFAKRKK
jgi:DNA-binding transcriptional ArsR family regulator